MAAPVSTLVYPADSDVGIPVGAAVKVYFDSVVDLQTAKDSIVIYGADFDRTSGPDSALWVDGKEPSNPFFLSSPGFNGTVEVDVTHSYINLSDNSDATPGDLANPAAATAAGVGSLITVTPKSNLAAETEYKLYVNGDPNALGINGVSSRTVWDIVPGGGNASATGDLEVYGTFEGSVSDVVNVKITTSGDIGTAKYKWWYASELESEARLGKVTARRYRRLEDGLQLRFTGSGFVADDTFSFAVEPAERMATSFLVTFTTNDGTFTAAPVSPSTPATSEPPASVLPDVTTATGFTLSESSPANKAYNVNVQGRTITLTFSQDVDPATITADSIKLYSYPASGEYSETSAPQELVKQLTVSGNIVTIKY